MKIKTNSSLTITLSLDEVADLQQEITRSLKKSVDWYDGKRDTFTMFMEVLDDYLV